MKTKQIKKKAIMLFRMDYNECLTTYNSLYKENSKELDSIFSFINSLLSNCYFHYNEDMQISWFFGEFSLGDVEETDGFFSYVMIRMILERKGLLITEAYTETLSEHLDTIMATAKDKCTSCMLFRLINRIW